MPTTGPRWPLGGEIDVFEGINNADRTIHSTLHFGDTNTACTGRYRIPSGQPDTSEAFHTYGMLWNNANAATGQPVFRFFFDDNEVITNCQTWNPGSAGPYPAPFTLSNFYLILNLAVGGSWPGNPGPETIFPATMLVDYVRVYQSASRPVSVGEILQGNNRPRVVPPPTPASSRPRRNRRNRQQP